MRELFLVFTLLFSHGLFAAESCTIFPTGHERILARHNGRVNSAEFSPDGTKVVTASYDDTSKIIDIKSGKERVISYKKGVRSAVFSPDGTKVMAVTKNGDVKIFDLKKDKEEDISYGEVIHSAAFSPDGSKVVMASTLGTAKILDLKNRHEQIISHKDSVYSAQFSSDGQKIVTASGDETAKIFDLKSGKEQVFSHDGVVYHATFSPDGSKVATASLDGHVKIIDLKSGKIQVIPFENSVISANFSSDGSKVVTAAYDDDARIFDLKSGKVQTIPHKHTVYSATFSSDGKQILSADDTGLVKLTGITRSCIPNSRYLISKTATFRPCEMSPSIKDTQAKNLLDIYIRSLCDSKFDKSSWISLHSNLKNSVLSIDEAKLYLKRFSKPDGFDPDTDSKILLSIFESELIDSEPELIGGALAGVLYKSNLLYEELFWRYPKLATLKYNAKKSDECTSESEKKEISNVAEAYLKHLLRKKPSKTKWNDWSSLLPLSPLLSKLPHDEIHADGGYLDRIAQSLTDGVADDSRFNGLFPSKVYKFTANRVGEIFGIKRKPLTDLTTTRTSDEITPLILSSESMPESNNEFGFSIKSENRIYIPSNLLAGNVIANPKLSWPVGDKKYRADLKITLGESKDLIPKKDSPDYASLKSDGKLTGVVIAGSNMDNPLELMDNYLTYYKKLDYEFDAPKEIPHLKKWLENEVAGGKADYMIKEAHSDGDEKNLFRMDKSAQLIVGKRTLEDGTEEIINLIFPSKNGSGTEFLPNDDFGKWVKKREKDQKGDFIYFNTSCWSKTKAVNEIQAAQSPILVNIPSTTIMYTFTGKESNGMTAMLGAFLEEKNYNGIREAMSVNEGYKKRISDVLIFPDEPDYDRYIRDLVKRPVNTEIKIKDELGVPYSFEEVAR